MKLRTFPSEFDQDYQQLDLDLIGEIDGISRVSRLDDYWIM